MLELRAEESTGCTHVLAGQTLWGVAPSATFESGVPDLDALPESPRFILRSANDTHDAESSFASWSGAAWSSFEWRIEEATERLASRSPQHRLVIWPGPGSVLSDAVSTLSFARKHTSIGLLIDPAAWITLSMAPDAEDHLARFAAALALCESLDAVAVRPVADLDADACARLLAPAIERAGAVLR